jgi:branched-subunit amino acid transport protein
VNVWLVLLGVALGTYGFRVAMFLLVGDRGLPSWTDRPLVFISPAAIGALVGGMLLTSRGHLDVVGLPELASVAVAFVTVRRTGDVAKGLLLAFPVLWLLGAGGL